MNLSRYEGVEIGDGPDKRELDRGREALPANVFALPRHIAGVGQ